MKTYEVNGVVRTEIGKKATSKLRAEENIPCVMYGGEKVVHFSASEGDFRKLIFTPNVYLIKINIDGAVYDAVIQEIQFHPVTDKVLHIDFLQISEDKDVKIEIPVILNGLAEGVKAGGKLQLLKRRLKVKALAKDLPDTLDVNVEQIKLGATIKVGELAFDNITLLDHPSSVIAAVKLTRAAKGAKGEGEEGEEEVASAE